MDIQSLVQFFYLPIVYPQIQWLKPITNPKAKIRFLCQLPYEGHPSGCPSFKSHLCPPMAFDQQSQIRQQLQTLPNLLLFIAKFNFAKYQTEMQWKHKTWSSKQIQCCLYYQKSVKKYFFAYIANHCDIQNDLILGCGSGFHRECYSMEAIGINVFGTLKNLRIPFEVKPKTMITFVSLVASDHVPMHQKTMFELFAYSVTKQSNKEYYGEV